MNITKNECALNGNSWNIEINGIRLGVSERDGKIYFTCIDGVQVNVWIPDQNIKSFKDVTGFFLGKYEK